LEAITAKAFCRKRLYSTINDWL